jgi:hypothetical protein
VAPAGELSDILFYNIRILRLDQQLFVSANTVYFSELVRDANTRPKFLSIAQENLTLIYIAKTNKNFWLLASSEQGLC